VRTDSDICSSEVSPLRVLLICDIQYSLRKARSIRFFSSEDLAFIVLQFWLLSSATLAVKKDSVPHLYVKASRPANQSELIICNDSWTVIITRGLMTAWSSYSVWRTQAFEVIFRKLYANPGTPCSIDFFPSYIRTRTTYEVVTLLYAYILNFERHFFLRFRI
jgi:hypothetical protein